MLKKAVITAAGLGTRLLPITKELPKEMLPLFSVSDNAVGLKPIIHIVFESLLGVGVSEVCFIVGKSKRAIEDYFTPDADFIEVLRAKGVENRANELMKFYSAIRNAKIFFINQPEPRGFGDAVLRAEPFVGADPFIVHAGDDAVISEGHNHLRRLVKVFQEYDCDATLLAEDVEDPRAYGVLRGKVVNDYGSILRVLDIIEKPREPPTNIAAIAVYAFKPKIFSYLRNVKPDSGGEVQLTAAIKAMIDDGCDVCAVKLKPGERRLDVGTPQSYWKALYESYQLAVRRMTGLVMSDG
ncbi:sugar phosphate nucleotidyltransferase [Thermofilum pendens]